MLIVFNPWYLGLFVKKYDMALTDSFEGCSEANRITYKIMWQCHFSKDTPREDELDSWYCCHHCYSTPNSSPGTIAIIVSETGFAVATDSAIISHGSCFCSSQLSVQETGTYYWSLGLVLLPQSQVYRMKQLSGLYRFWSRREVLLINTHTEKFSNNTGNLITGIWISKT